MRICVLGSGSAGNAILIEAPKGYLLVDAGFSWREIKSRARRAGLDLRGIGALILTHEHADHTRGLSTLYRRGTTIVASPGTLRALGHRFRRSIHLDGDLELLGLRIHAFPVPHDAVAPRGLVLEMEGARLGIATDLGEVTDFLLGKLSGCKALIFESNHDLEMLLSGPYPWHLKLRILGPLGHLSNDAAGTALAELAEGARAIFLAHLSQENNRPGLALETVARYLDRWDGALYLTYPDRPSATVDLFG